MPARDPNERALIARIAISERWARASKQQRAAATVPARNGLIHKFELEVDPDGTLPPAERARRVDLLLQAHMQRMALKAAQSRRKAREAHVAAEQAEREFAALEDGGGET